MSGRLPKTITPSHYDLSYQRIDLKAPFTFAGRVTIHFVLNEPPASDATTFTIVLNAHQMQLQNAKLQNGTTSLEAVSIAYDLRQQRVALIFEIDAPEAPTLLKDSAWKLTIDFTGHLNNQMCGLYRSTYTALDGSTQTMATTQLEATDARRAFPCLDEPAYKATFQLSVSAPAHLQCLSNTPMQSLRKSIEQSKAWQHVTFHTTPKMSTYLVALIVGEFEQISQISGEGVLATVYTTAHKSERARFCLDTAVQALDLYQTLFHVPYPLNKLDIVAVPDFAAGAMENWGVCTFREAKILADPRTTSESQRRGMARTTCHEIAHQWFGNLVTPEFWTQLWLKEGMARFLEFVAVDHIFPEWQAWTEFVQSVYFLAMSLDAMQSSHPIEVEVQHADEIVEIFDSISYAKGASVARMIASYIGHDAFFEGMRLYLTNHAYENTLTNDLWQAMEEASGKPVVKLAKAWVLKVGFPVLRLGPKGSITVQRYLSSGKTSEVETPEWIIPVTAMVEGIDDVQGPWLVRYGDTAALESKLHEWESKGLWYKLNMEQTGFYRVCYTASQFERLGRQLHPDSRLSVTDRLGLVSDSFAASRAGFCSIVDSLSLVKDFGSHSTADYVVWQELYDNLLAILRLFRSEAFLPSLQALVRQIYEPRIPDLGWKARKGESARVGSLRASVIGILGNVGNEDTLKQSFDYLRAFIDHGEPLDGDLRGAIFKNAMRYNEVATFELLHKLIGEPTIAPEETRDALRAIGSVENPQRHAEMLDFTLFSGNIRLQDVAFILSSLSTSSDAGGLATWRWYVDNNSRIQKAIGDGLVWSTVSGLACRGLTTLEQAKEVEAFFAAHDPKSAKRRVEQSLEIVRTTALRRDRDRDALASYFQTHRVRTLTTAVREGKETMTSPNALKSIDDAYLENNQALNTHLPATDGFFGDEKKFGGCFVPPTLESAMKEVTDAYEHAKRDPKFLKEFTRLRKQFIGRPSPIYHCQRLSQKLGGAQIYLKREDLNHTGSHKINHCLGEAILAKRMKKTKLIAETGAGQYGVAVATVAALMGLECEIHMG